MNPDYLNLILNELNECIANYHMVLNELLNIIALLSDFYTIEII